MKKMAFIYEIKNVTIQSNANVASEGEMTIHFSNEDKVFPVISGKYGNGSISIGIYSVEKPIVLLDKAYNDAYKRDGVPWYARLTPQFNCERTGLLIHPDGNLPGTLGCLGVLDNDQDLLHILKQIFDITEEVELVVV